jgi:uroporphyrinogen-III synthase
MTICLITRTRPGAQVTEAWLKARGFEAVSLPAAVIVPTGAHIETSGVQALLMTSASAARSSVMSDTILHLPVYAVGDATAQAATLAGFTNVISAGGDGAALAVLAADRMQTDAGALLHLRGQEVAGDVTGMLTACGFQTRSIEVYRTDDHPDFEAGLLRYLSNQSGYILVHSPAGARRVAAAISAATSDLDRWHIFGLSKACLLPLENLGFASLTAASQPDENALMEAILAFGSQSRP